MLEEYLKKTEPEYYRFLYNREAKQVAVQNCSAEDAGAHKTPKLTVSNNCEIKCVAMLARQQGGR